MRKKRILSLVLAFVVMFNFGIGSVFAADSIPTSIIPSVKVEKENNTFRIQDKCICDALCTEKTINSICPVCCTSGGDLSVCMGYPEESTDLSDKNIWDGTIASSFAGGSGTKDDPYLISNGAELAYLSNLTNSNEYATRSYYFLLTQDIYLNDTSDLSEWELIPPSNEWIPIGFRDGYDYSHQFHGNFDGNGYAIYGLYIDSDEDRAVGLFGNCESATISNLSIVDSYIKGKRAVGGICGSSREYTLFNNCYTKSIIRGESWLGGIAGQDDDGIFQYCCNESDIIATEGTAGGIVGGSVGEAANYATGTIEYCYNLGSITAHENVGGISSGVAYTSDCYNAGIVKSIEQPIGAISGNLSAISPTNTPNYIQRCYNAGVVACANEEELNVILGEKGFFTSVNNVYWMNTMPDVDLGDGVWYFPNLSGGFSIEEMSDPNNFTGFDFTNTWYIDKDSGYSFPQLAFPDEARRYAELSVVDITTNEEIKSFTVKVDESTALIFVSDGGTHYIVGNGATFASNAAIEIQADGYEPYFCYSTDLKNSISIRYAPNNVLALTPSGIEVSKLDKLQQTYVLAHTQFYEEEYPHLVENYGFQNALWQYDNGEYFALATIGNWLDNIGSITSLSSDGIQYKVSYYEQYFLDLLDNMADMDTLDPLDVSNLKKVSTVTSWIDLIQKVHEDELEIPLFEAQQELDEWNELWKDVELDASNQGLDIRDVLYDEAIDMLAVPDGTGNTYLDKFIRKIQGAENLKKHPTILDSVFKGTSYTGKAVDYITTGANEINAFVDTTTTYVLISTYTDVSTQLFDILGQAADMMESKYADGITEVIEKYEFDPENQEKFYGEYLKDLAGHTGDFVYDRFLKERTKNVAYTVLSNAMDCPVSAVSAIASAFKTGHFFGEGLTGLGGQSEQYTIIYYIAPLEKALEEIVKEYGDKMIETGDFEDAQRFESAYRALSITNQYLYKCYWAMGANETAFGTKDHHVGQIDEVMEYGASMQTLWKRTLCHGDIHVVENRFKYTSIQCPVDVYVYDKSNELVVSIINEQVVEYDPAFTVLVSNGKKSLVYPQGQNYRIRIVAREAGVMQYLVSEISGNGTRNVDFYNIPIKQEQEFIGDIPSEFNVNKMDYTLYTDEETINPSYDSNETAQVLDTPTQIAWENTSATWKAVNNAIGYSVGLYRNGEQVAVLKASETSLDLQNQMKEGGNYAFYVIAIGDGKDHLDSRRSGNSWEIEVQAAEKSTDTSVTSVTVNNVPGTINDSVISVVLPYGSTIPINADAISIALAAGATCGNTLSTSNGGKTWTFTVTAEDGITQKKYIITISVDEDPATENKADIEAAKFVIENYEWTVSQSVANTSNLATAWIESQLKSMNLNDVNYTITITDIIPAISGTPSDKNGTNGKINFTIILSKGENDAYLEDTILLAGTIIATPDAHENSEGSSGNHANSGGHPISSGGFGSVMPDAAPIQITSSFVSDTTSDFTVNGRYQFRITSTNGRSPTMTVSNSNFTVSLASQSGNDYFFVITAIGVPGSTAVIYVNNRVLLTATVGGTVAPNVISDTTYPFFVTQGGTYQFRLTAAERPSFVAGSPSFTVKYAGQKGNDFFYKVHAEGQVGDGCGFYINGAPTPVAVATIA